MPEQRATSMTPKESSTLDHKYESLNTPWHALVIALNHRDIHICYENNEFVIL
jgi:hypothetical protein